MRSSARVLSPASTETRNLKLFIISASVAVALCVTGGFLGMAIRNRSMILQEMLNRAREEFSTIVLMRKWNSSYGGVFVEKKVGVTSNPYLKNPDITGTDGTTYTRKNPALMTRELSELISRDQGFTFHITSLKPLNPSNTPDPEEVRALQAFESGAQERYWIQTIAGKGYFRYMGSLKVDYSCLACHAEQGYRIGDIRGGISITFDIHELQAALQSNLEVISALAVLTTGILVGSLLFLFRQLVFKLQEARSQLVALATTDALTGLPNRRTVLDHLESELARNTRSGHPVGCIMVDVDHFKQVNDHFGHAAGDEVLHRVAQYLKDSLRPYDSVGRIGGEEFLVVLPGADREELLMVAERLRTGLPESVQVGPPDQRQSVTVSMGIASYHLGESSEALIARADRGLYRAKESGRNKVEEDRT